MSGEVPGERPEETKPPLRTAEIPPRSRGVAVTSRVMIGIAIVLVGGFCYLLGARLSGSSSTTTSTSSAQGGGFGGPGGPGGFGGQASRTRSATTAGSATSAASGAGTSGASAAGARRRNGQSGAGSGSRSSGSGGATTVTTTAATTGQLSAQRATAGSVVPSQESNVPAQQGGSVQQVLQQVGAQVSQGQALVTLSSDSLQAALSTAQSNLQKARLDLVTQTNANLDQRAQLSLQVSSAQAALSTAQQTYTADQQIYKIGGIAQSELNTAKSQVDSARASLASAQASLSTNERAKNETLAQLQLSVNDAQDSLTQAKQNIANLTVRAPFDGQISAVAVSPGENIGAGGTVLTLVSNTRQVSFSVVPTDASALHLGQTLNFKVNQSSYQVKLDHSPGAPVNSVVALSARVLGDRKPTIGAIGTISYSVPVATGTLLPASAVQQDGAQNYVFVNKNGKAMQTSVTLLGQSGDQAAVSGVAGGTSVLSEPPTGLLDGAAITVDNSAGASGASATSGTSSAGTSEGRRFRRERGGAASTSSGGSSSQGSSGASAGGRP